MEYKNLIILVFVAVMATEIACNDQSQGREGTGETSKATISLTAGLDHGGIKDHLKGVLKNLEGLFKLPKVDLFKPSIDIDLDLDNKGKSGRRDDTYQKAYPKVIYEDRKDIDYKVKENPIYVKEIVDTPIYVDKLPAREIKDDLQYKNSYDVPVVVYKGNENDGLRGDYRKEVLVKIPDNEYNTNVGLSSGQNVPSIVYTDQIGSGNVGVDQGLGLGLGLGIGSNRGSSSIVIDDQSDSGISGTSGISGSSVISGSSGISGINYGTNDKIIIKEEPILEGHTITKEKAIIKEHTIYKDMPIISEHTVVKERPRISEHTLIRQRPIIKEHIVINERPIIKKHVVIKDQPIIKEHVVIKEHPIIKDEVIVKEQPTIITDEIIIKEKPTVITDEVLVKDDSYLDDRQDDLIKIEKTEDSGLGLFDLGAKGIADFGDSLGKKTKIKGNLGLASHKA